MDWTGYNREQGLIRGTGKPAGEFVWLDVLAPEPKEEAELLRGMGVATDALERMRSGPRRLAILEHRAFFVVQFFGMEAGPRLEVLVGRRSVLTVHRRDLPEVNRLLDWLGDGYRPDGPGEILLKLLESLAASYAEAVERLFAEVEEVNELLVKARYRGLTERLFGIKRKALRLRQVMEPSLDVFHLLKEEDFTVTGKAGKTAFADLDFHLRHLFETVDGLRESLNSTVQAYSSIQGNRINETMRLLTIVSVLFLPPTLVASIYGMNFQIPEYHWRFGYEYSLLLMAVLTGGLLFYVKWHR